MDKTTSFLGGIIAGAVGLGVASWFFAEYLPNKREQLDAEKIGDEDESKDEQDSSTENKSAENVDTAEASSTDDKTSSSDVGDTKQENINSSEVEANPS